MSLPAHPYRGGGPLATPGTFNRECRWREWSEPSRFAAEHEFGFAGIAWGVLLALGVLYFAIAYGSRQQDDATGFDAVDPPPVHPVISHWNVAVVLALVYVCFLLFLMSRPRTIARFEVTPTETRYIAGVHSLTLKTDSVTGVEPYETPRMGSDDHSPDWDIRLVLRDGEKKQLSLESSESVARARAARLGEAFAFLQTDSSLGDGRMKGDSEP
jgi:hypothetical protein